MPDADLYRIEELPKDELGGASGEKRRFRLEFVGKAPNERFPYTVANEVVSSFIGTVLGFNIPTVVPCRAGGETLAMVLWMKPAAREQQGPPLTSKKLQEYVELHEDEIHGAIILDLYLANSDLAFGPQRRNLAVDERGRLLLFDFGNALFYRDRTHAGIQAGVARLEAVEGDLRQMFDKAEKVPENYYFQLLRNWSLIEKWCDRLRQLPDYILEAAIGRISGRDRTSKPRGASAPARVPEEPTRFTFGANPSERPIVPRIVGRERIMTDFHYALIRFVPDMDRMEPINVGVILQGRGRIDFKLSPHVAKRGDVDTQVFQRWRTFLEEEVRGEAVPLLQPSKDSTGFLDHLSGLCEQTVLLTRPLAVVAQPDETFEEILDSLYDRLVAPPKQLKKNPERPTSQFREIEEEKQFRKRGMKKHPYLAIDGGRKWNAFRQVLNGENIVIDKVEVDNRVGLTADEIRKLSSGVEEFLAAFLGTSRKALPPQYFLIADELNEKFSEQTDEDFQAMREEYDRVVKIVGGRGGTVVQKKEDVLGFAAEIDKKLPALEQSGGK